jgi:hypothetical protein
VFEGKWEEGKEMKLMISFTLTQLPEIEYRELTKAQASWRFSSVLVVRLMYKFKTQCQECIEPEPQGLFIIVTAQLNLNLNMSWELHDNG